MHGPEAAFGIAEVPLPFFEVGVDDQGRQRLAVLAEDGAQGCGAVLLEDLGRVLGVQLG